MKSLTILLVVLLSASVVLSAQTNSQVATNSDQDLLTSDERARTSSLRYQYGQSANVQQSDVSLTQIGQGNLADLRLKQTLVHDRSRLAVSQLGGESGNEVYMSLQGAGVDASIIQRGDGNLYDGHLTGNAQSLHIVQDGYNNELQQNAILDAGANIELIQYGNGNIMNADDVGHSIKVTQRNGGRVTLSTLEN